MAPQGTTIDNLVNKDDLEDYFDNLATAVTTKKAVLVQLTAMRPWLPTTPSLWQRLQTSQEFWDETPTAQQVEICQTNESLRFFLTIKKRAFKSMTHASNWPRMQAYACPIGKLACDMERPLT